MGQTGSHVEHEHDPFIKQVSNFNLNMTRTRLASTHDLFINGLIMLGLRVVSVFATPTTHYGNRGCDSSLHERRRYTKTCSSQKSMA